jgi:outer membrane protein OmpA-like peptidoglycan-associated protein
VSLGGSAASGYATISEVFGGATYRATYVAFGNIMRAQLPDLLPSYDPVDRVLELRYLRDAGELLRARGGPVAPAEAHPFSRAMQPDRVLSHKSWEIPFDTGAATFRVPAVSKLDEIYGQALAARDAIIFIDGHTDDKGGADANLRLSVSRAQAVYANLRERNPGAFPDGRVRVRGHGMTAPVGDNSTEGGRAKNRRVEITFAMPRGT